MTLEEKLRRKIRAAHDLGRVWPVHALPLENRRLASKKAALKVTPQALERMREARDRGCSYTVCGHFAGVSGATAYYWLEGRLSRSLRA